MKKDRRIIFNSEILEESAKILMDKMLELDHLSDKLPITLFLNSEGGDVSQAFSICSLMKLIKAPIHVIGSGVVASAAVDIFLHGDKRAICSNTSFMVHCTSFGDYGDTTDARKFKQLAKELDQYDKALSKFLASFDGSPDEKAWMTKMKRTTYLKRSELKEYGFITHEAEEL